MPHGLFGFEMSPWELMIRGSLIYRFLFLLLRFVLRRDATSVGLADILLIVLIADAAQNGMPASTKLSAKGLFSSVRSRHGISGSIG